MSSALPDDSLTRDRSRWRDMSPLAPLPIAPRNDPRPIPILDKVLRIELDGCLIRCAPGNQIVGTSDDFVFGVHADNAEGKVFRKHGAGASHGGAPAPKRENAARGAGCRTDP